MQAILFCQVFWRFSFFTKLDKAEPRGSPASGRLRSLVQPRGEAARLVASASRLASGAAALCRPLQAIVSAFSYFLIQRMPFNSSAVDQCFHLASCGFMQFA